MYSRPLSVISEHEKSKQADQILRVTFGLAMCLLYIKRVSENGKRGPRKIDQLLKCLLHNLKTIEIDHRTQVL